jgi:hypothetical protein
MRCVYMHWVRNKGQLLRCSGSTKGTASWYPLP